MEEKRIIELLKQKVEEATPQELKEALEFFDMVDVIRYQAKKEQTQEILDEFNKLWSCLKFEKRGTKVIGYTFDKKDMDKFKRHLSTSKAKELNSSSKKNCFNPSCDFHSSNNECTKTDMKYINKCVFRLRKSKMNDLKPSLRRRVGAYKGRYFAEMLDTNFKSIFSQTQRELGLKDYDIDKIINLADEKQIRRMHDKLSEFQHGF